MCFIMKCDEKFYSKYQQHNNEITIIVQPFPKEIIFFMFFLSNYYTKVFQYFDMFLTWMFQRNMQILLLHFLLHVMLKMMPIELHSTLYIIAMKRTSFDSFCRKKLSIQEIFFQCEPELNKHCFFLKTFCISS